MSSLTLEYNGVEKSLAAWGFAQDGAVLVLGNMTEDTLQLTLVGADYSSAAVFPFEALIKLRSARAGSGTAWSGGVLEFTGKRLRETIDARPAAEGIIYTFAGPWYDLARTLYQQEFVQEITAAYGLAFQSEVLLFTKLQASTGYTIGPATNGEQITDGLNHLLAQYAAQGMTAPFQIGTIEPATYLPSLWCKPMMCSELIQKCLELSPDVKVFFDYSVSPPRIHARKQSSLASTTLPIADGVSHAGLRLEPRPDLQARAVVIYYKITGSINGSPTVVFTKDKYGPHGANHASDPEGGLRVLVETVDLAGSSLNSVSGSIVCEAVNANAGTHAARRAWWASQDNHFLDTRVRFQDDTGAFAAIPNAVIIDEDTGAVVSLASYPNKLVDGAVSPWMKLTGGAGVVTKRCRVMSAMTYAQYDAAATAGSEIATNGKKIHQYQNRDHHVQITLTNGVTGDYSSVASAVAGEAIPAGVAQAVYESLATLQYEGGYVKVQTEISGGISLANNLNLSNGRAEWATMNALIQSIRKDFGTGITEVQVGVARHLGVQDISNLLRMWRFRRVWQNPDCRATGAANGAGGGVAIARNVPKTNTHIGVDEPSELYVIKRPAGSPTGTPTGEINLTPKTIATVLTTASAVPTGTDAEMRKMEPREIELCPVLGVRQYMLVLGGEPYTKP